VSTLCRLRREFSILFGLHCHAVRPLVPTLHIVLSSNMFRVGALYLFAVLALT